MSTTTRRSPATVTHLHRLPLGQIVATPGALRACTVAGVPPLRLVARHQRGDWGQLCREDETANRVAIREGLRVFSVYVLPNGEKVWVITEADRASTCVLLPSEY